MKQQIKTPCGKPIRYARKTPHKFLEKFSKNLYGTTGGTYSSRFLRPVMAEGHVDFLISHFVIDTINW